MTLFNNLGSAVAALVAAMSMMTASSYAHSHHHHHHCGIPNISGTWVGSQVCPMSSNDNTPSIDYSPSSQIYIYQDAQNNLYAYFDFYGVPYYGMMPQGTDQGGNYHFTLTNPYTGGTPFGPNTYIEVIDATLNAADSNLSFSAHSVAVGNETFSTPGNAPVGNYIENCAYEYKQVSSSNGAVPDGFVVTSAGLIPRS